MENIDIIGRERHGFARTIKEYHLHQGQPAHPKENVCKYNLPHIWIAVLINTPKLQIKHLQGNPEHQQVQPTLLALCSLAYIGTDNSYIPSD